MKECPRCPACFDDEEAVCPDDGSPLEEPFPGEPVIDGTYRIEARLGRGGMGVVYRARHLGLDRRFALKLIRFAYAPAVGGRSFAERFALEARALGRLRHPGVVQVTDYGVDPRALPYLVMEYLEGPTLWELARREPHLTLEATLGVLEGVAQAIDYGHEQGVLHRDIKSANVVATADGPKVLDFGLARLFDMGPLTRRTGPEGPHENDAREGRSLPGGEGAPLTQPGRLPGTPPYVAPELREGGPETTACDVYSFGVLAYELLCGGLPPARDGAPARFAPPSHASAVVPPELDTALAPALASDPAQRPAAAGAVVGALRAALARARRRHWKVHEVPRRLRLAVLVAPALAALAMVVGRQGVMRELEQRTADARLVLQARHPPDPRLVVVTVDEASLADPTPLADRGDEFGALLERAFAMGARGVAVDFLLPERWRHAPAFSQMVLRRREALTLAAFYSSSSDQTVGTECVGGLTAAALGPARTRELFGLVNVDEDPDGVTREARLFYADAAGGRWDSWITRAARRLEATAGRGESLRLSDRFRIDPSVDWPRLRRVSWKDLPGELDRDPRAFEGRLLLLGGEFAASGDDYHRIPGGLTGPPAVSGTVLHAIAIDSLLHARPVRELSWTAALAAAGLVAVVVLALVLCLTRTARLAPVSLAANFVYLIAAILAFRLGGWLLPMVAPVLAGSLSLLAGLLLRLRLPSFPGGSEMASPSPTFRAAAGLALTLITVGAAQAAEVRPADVAVISSLSGRARIAPPPAFLPRAAVVFDWLPARTVIEVEAGASLDLAFASGRRCQLEGKAKAVLGADGLRLLAGTNRPLPPVPAFPRFPALALDRPPGGRSGAIRVRAVAERPVRGVYPMGPSSSLASATVLSFDPVDGVGRYHLEVEDRTGATVLELDTPATVVRLPPGTLQPGGRYLWRVSGTDRVGVVSRGEGEFMTLPERDVRRRAALRSALERRSEPELFALAAEIDRRLGLWREAREGFEAVLPNSPDPLAVQARLARIDARLRIDPTPPR